MTFRYIKYECKDYIGILTLNSPSTSNSLSQEMAPEFKETIKYCRSDKDLRVLIITGEGKHFSSGGDFKLLDENTRKSFDENKRIMLDFYSHYLSIHDLEIPTIAAINGAAIGAGCCLAVACDLRVAAPSTKLGMTFIKLGLHPGMGGTFFLPKIVGISHALELFYTGKIIDGEEAYRLGIINRLAKEDTVLETAMEFARTISSNAPIPIKQVRNAVLGKRNTNLEASLQYEAQSQAHCYSTKDFKEGLKAIRNRSKPHFSGE
jgi:enoyl-CoA hydratase